MPTDSSGFFGQPHSMHPLMLNLSFIPCEIDETKRCKLFQLQLNYAIQQAERDSEFYKKVLAVVKGEDILV